jgi:hypothetical protein
VLIGRCALTGLADQAAAGFLNLNIRAALLEPDAVEDLEEELLEIGFSPEAARWIVGKVPE